jgi:protein-tyrosine-phosphatase
LNEGILEERINQHTPRIMRKHKDDLQQATSLIVMTETHRDLLVASKYREKLLLLSQVSGDENIENIPDPALLKDFNEYETTMNIIKTYLTSFLNSILVI